MKSLEQLNDYEDIVEIYMRSLEEPMLDETEQKEYLKRIKAGDLEARDEFVERNLRLVIKEAKRYLGRGVEFLDLIQEGNMGLLKAIEKFDMSYTNRFSTYAVNWIKQGMTRAIADKSRTIRIPVHFNEKLNEVKSREKYLTQRDGEAPTKKKLAASLNISESRLNEILLLDETLSTVSLNAPVNPDKDEASRDMDELEDFVDNNELSLVERVENDEMAALINSTILKTLNERELQVIKMRFGFGDDTPKTLEEVGKEFGVTRERIRQIEAKALVKLRNSKNIRHLEEYNPNYKD